MLSILHAFLLDTPRYLTSFDNGIIPYFRGIKLNFCLANSTIVGFMLEPLCLTPTPDSYYVQFLMDSFKYEDAVMPVR